MSDRSGRDDGSGAGGDRSDGHDTEPVDRAPFGRSFWDADSAARTEDLRSSRRLWRRNDDATSDAGPDAEPDTGQPSDSPVWFDPNSTLTRDRRRRREEAPADDPAATVAMPAILPSESISEARRRALEDESLAATGPSVTRSSFVPPPRPIDPDSEAPGLVDADPGASARASDEGGTPSGEPGPPEPTGSPRPPTTPAVPLPPPADIAGAPVVAHTTAESVPTRSATVARATAPGDVPPPADVTRASTPDTPAPVSRDAASTTPSPTPPPVARAVPDAPRAPVPEPGPVVEGRSPAERGVVGGVTRESDGVFRWNLRPGGSSQTVPPAPDETAARAATSAADEPVDPPTGLVTLGLAEAPGRTRPEADLTPASRTAPTSRIAPASRPTPAPTSRRAPDPAERAVPASRESAVVPPERVRDEFLAPERTVSLDVPLGAPAAASRATAAGTPRYGDAQGARTPLAVFRRRRAVAVVVGVVLLAAVAVGAFLGGRALVAPAAVSTPAPAPAPAAASPAVPTIAAVPATAPIGEQRWDALGGGECIEPYTTPWAETFTVVDCAGAHTAQVVRAATWPVDASTAWPGESVLAQQVTGLCTADGVVDAATAAQFTDLQVQGAFPATAEAWDAGQRTYYCFASQASGGPLVGSLLPAP